MKRLLFLFLPLMTKAQVDAGIVGQVKGYGVQASRIWAHPQFEENLGIEAISIREQVTDENNDWKLSGKRVPVGIVTAGINWVFNRALLGFTSGFAFTYSSVYIEPHVGFRFKPLDFHLGYRTHLGQMMHVDGLYGKVLFHLFKTE